MTIHFYKYQATGNDFVMLDNRNNIFDKNDTKTVNFLCDRRFGIGADGLILIENHEESDFEMIYYNSDGSQSLCGNGGRCAVAFAKYLGIIKDATTFKAIDGLHYATIKNDEVALQMADIDTIERQEDYVFLNTGSPHHIKFHDDLKALDVKAEGSKIRYGEPYGKEGSNVNFVCKIGDNVFGVRTYERGVEDETLSCGTGVTAVGIAMHYLGETKSNEVSLKAQGGDLRVTFNSNDNRYSNVWLIGPAQKVFEGEIVL